MIIQMLILGEWLMKFLILFLTYGEKTDTSEPKHQICNMQEL